MTSDDTDDRPVLVLQHLSGDGPAYLGTWLRANGVAADVRNAEAGDAHPTDLKGYRGLAILGGEMSANDALPVLRHEERLILHAMETGVPVIGHCLGGQLMARALGARIVASPRPEIGWQPVQVFDRPDAAKWFGAPGEHTVFQWHYEAFELPAGATALATSEACRHQAFSIGPHIAMQFHVEVDAAKLERWSLEEGTAWSAARIHPTVQEGEAMRREALSKLPGHQRLADRVYRQWLRGDACRH